MAEDGSYVRSGSAPHGIVAFSNLVIGILRMSDATNIASVISSIGWQRSGALRLLGLRHHNDRITLGSSLLVCITGIREMAGVRAIDAVS